VIYSIENEPGIRVASEDDYRQVDILVLAAGFEDRAFQILRSVNFDPDMHCVLLKYKNDLQENEQAFAGYKRLAHERFGAHRTHIIEVCLDNIESFSSCLSGLLNDLPRSLYRAAVDVSGCTGYLTCLVLKCLRERFPFGTQKVFYTSAENYHPSFEEYERMRAKAAPNDIESLPKSMALEMSRNLVLEEFAGHRSRDARSCLVIFAGYEIHRSSGVIDAVNPALLLLLYGRPGGTDLDWRTELSKQLHRRFEKNRRTASEVVSTLDPMEAVALLDQYYGYLTDEYDLVISPICSKMNSVAAYIFWERYGEVQLTFPLPIGYDPKHGPIGVDKTYCLDLRPRRGLVGLSNDLDPLLAQT
jgi:hypothetical protein